jgi:hypothetical protein
MVAENYFHNITRKSIVFYVENDRLLVKIFFPVISLKKYQNCVYACFADQIV